MHNKITKAITASFMAAAMLTTTVATVAPMTVSAGEILGESDYTYKALPWHTCETNPGKQTFELTDAGEAHITVITPEGGEKSKWDLQFRHRNIDLKKNHEYKISCRIKSNRSGMEICSKIGDISGKLEYVELKDGKFVAGPSMGGEWGNAAKLTTEYQTFEGTFKCTEDLESVEWAFHYAKDSNGYGGNAQAGDEIWFDDMHLEDLTSDEYDTNQDDYVKLGAVRRDDSGLENNYISVNQIGYYSNLSKVAVLGDNKGDITYGASSIDIAEGSTYDFKVINDTTGAVALTGKTSAAKKDLDSGDIVCKIDFTELTDAGTYHIEVGEWKSFSFRIGDDIYTNKGEKENNMLTNALNYYYQNRSGIDIESAYITSGDKSSLKHQGGHKTDTATVQKEWVRSYNSAEEATGTYASSKITASGGWYDAGDHGKYVVNGGISVWTLQNMYERTVVQGSEDKFDNGSGTVVIPETNNGVPDILDEAAVELDWMMEMVVQSNEPTWGKYAGLVYHKLHDHKWTGLGVRPWDYESEWGTVRIVKPPTFAATLNFVACAAQAARLWAPYDSEKAAEYLEAAKTSYEAFKKIYADYPAYTDAENSNPTSLYAPLDQAIGGGAYGDSDVTDDAYWAACELYAATGDSEYYTDLSGYKDAFKVVSYLEGGENKGSFSSFNWGNTASCGSLTLYLNENNSKLTSLTDANKATITDTIKEAADLYVSKENEQGYGIPYEGATYSDPVNLPADLEITGYEWGSNSFVVNNAMIMAYAYDITDDVKYMNGVTTSMDYILGTNPLSVSFVTGYGSYHISRPHHRYWSHELDSSLPMAPDGIISGGPNAGLQDPYVRALGFVPGAADNPSQRCYVDSIEAWSTNEVTINWNAPFAWVVSFLQDEAANVSSEGVLKVTPSTVEVEVGKTETLKPTVDGTEVDATFKSNDSSVVTVDANGTITGVAEGSTTITVTYGDKSVEVKVNVTDSTKTSETDTSETNATEDTNATIPSYTGNASLLYGDVNLDLVVDSTDVVVLNKRLISESKYPLQNDQATEQANTADYDARKIDSKDSMAIINSVLGVISKDDLGPKK